jgi:ergothioneine biosynthesis protein EgtB
MPTVLATPHLNGSTPDLTAASLSERFRAVRDFSRHLCETLETEDFVIQSMPDCSPTKWHLAHTTWFFETFVLAKFDPDYQPQHPQYSFLFNSYYNAVGERHTRARRGLLSRPTVAETFEYRRAVDEAMKSLLSEKNENDEAFRALVILGLNHEQQHQELLITDIKNAFYVNPLRPVYRERKSLNVTYDVPLRWLSWHEGIYEIGFTQGDGDFCFDNETPRHRVFLESFSLANRLVTCGEYLQFMRDGGYQKPEFWLSAGWATVEENNWCAPLYWEEKSGDWQMMTLAGMRAVEDNEPVTHLSYYEAEAYARWADLTGKIPGARLPTEAEWEVAATQPRSTQWLINHGHFAEGVHGEGLFHPAPAQYIDNDRETELLQMFGEAWQWTRSQYTPYPGYRADAGALGEYNGKFMCNQWVLRGGSCATPRSHIRATYRNFFPPEARWQFSGLRLAR